MADDNATSDERLLARIQSGDRQAFALLVRRHTGRFHAAAYRMCGNTSDAADIVQDCFLKLWAKPHLWEEGRGAKFVTWFYKIVTNAALDHVRARRIGAGDDTLAVLPDHAEPADSALMEREEALALEEAIQSLPQNQKAALNLCFYEGLSNKDAAQALGIGHKAVESLLMRAKAGIREELCRRGILGAPDAQEKEHVYATKI